MTKSKALPPLERVRELLEYRPETGWLTCKARGKGRPRAGERAGSRNSNGYRYASIDGTSYREHRLIWLLCHGEDPGDLHVDHVNGKKADNRIANLRLATEPENQGNRVRLQSRNTSGITGVCWHKRTRKWRAQLGVNGRTQFLGDFKSFEEAIAARRAAELDHFGEFVPQRVTRSTRSREGGA